MGFSALGINEICAAGTRKSRVTRVPGLQGRQRKLTAAAAEEQLRAYRDAAACSAAASVGGTAWSGPAGDGSLKKLCWSALTALILFSGS